MKPNRSWIVLDGDPVLRKKCRDVILPLTEEEKNEINKMVSYIDSCYNGEGLEISQGIAVAAPQFGLDKKIIYIHTNINGNEIKYLLANPKITSESILKSYLSNGEGCLSVQDIHDGIVLRSERIIVSAIDLYTERNVEIKAEGILSICLQHEIDHLNGILFYQKISKNFNKEIEEAVKY